MNLHERNRRLTPSNNLLPILGQFLLPAERSPLATPSPTKQRDLSRGIVTTPSSQIQVLLELPHWLRLIWPIVPERPEHSQHAAKIPSTKRNSRCCYSVVLVGTYYSSKLNIMSSHSIWSPHYYAKEKAAQGQIHASFRSDDNCTKCEPVDTATTSGALLQAR